MKQKLILFSITIITIFLSYYVINIFLCYYAPPTYRPPYLINNNNDSICNIVYIGDSWAYMHKDHTCTIPQIIESECDCSINIYSYGINGITSKIIYENLFTNEDLKQFLISKAPKFCFISAGINDCNKKMGSDIYKESMDYIIQFFLYNNITPIILEIPNYSISKSYKGQSFIQKNLRKISMRVTGTPMHCKQIFRNALDELVREKGYQNKVCIIRYKSWNNDYLNDLKQLYLDDGLHLNEQGYAKLDSVIAKEIIKTYRPTTTPNISVISSTTRR